MNTERTDAEILAGSKVITKFNGKSYAWIQKPRREQRVIREELLKIAGLLFNVGEMGQMEQASCSLEAINAILAFCEDNHSEMDADMDDIEDYIKSSGVGSFAELLQDVYMVLYNEWLEPWLSGDTEAKKKKLTEASIQNQNSTK